MFSFLQYDFIQLALLITVIIGISSALLSPFLVLNNQALVADGLAHISFTGIAFALLFINEPLFISIPFVVLFSILIKYLSLKENINSDISIGIVSSISLAIGLIIVSKSHGFERSIESMLVGNIWTVTKIEVLISFIILLLILTFIKIYYKDLLLMTYDFKYAKFKKVKTNFLSYTLSALTAVLITVSVKTIGTLLISSFVIFPVVIGMQFKKDFKTTFIIGIIASIINVIIGIFMAHFLDIPAGSSIVIVYGLMLSLLLLFKKIYSRRNLNV